MIAVQQRLAHAVGRTFRHVLNVWHRFSFRSLTVVTMCCKAELLGLYVHACIIWIQQVRCVACHLKMPDAKNKQSFQCNNTAICCAP